MIAAHRQKLILRDVAQAGAVSVRRLCEQLEVSRETVRRDLAALDAKGLLQKTHGGALALAREEADVAARVGANAAGKRRVGARAAALVADGVSVVFDSGTTTRAVASALVERQGLTVYTNDLVICRLLARRNGNRVVLLGGEVQGHEDSTLGLDALATLAHYRADVAFVGAGGITPDGNLTDYSRAAAELRSRMLVAAGTAVVVADYSKFGRITPVRVANFSKARYLVTDRRPAPAIARALKAQGIRVIVAA